MKKPTLLFLFVTFFALATLSACEPSPPPTSAITAPTSLPSTLTPTPREEITVVPTNAFSGSGIQYVGPSVIHQEGNSLPTFQLLTRPSVELADNRIGLAFAGPGLVADLWNLPFVLDHLTGNGVKVLHSSMYEIEPLLIGEMTNIMFLQNSTNLSMTLMKMVWPLITL